MDQRSRSSRPNRRKTLPTSSIQSDTSAGAESTSTIMTRSPPVAASRTPQTAPQNRRSVKVIPVNSPFSLRSSPSTTAPGPGKTALRKKSRAGFEGAADEDDEAYRKGPHTLRKRAKIDYSAADFEDELPEIAIPAPRAATRKRRADSEVADDEYSTPAAQKRRATSRDFSAASVAAATRRRTPARRSIVEPQSFHSQPSDEDIVKDTIEVVGDSSDLVSSDDASDHDEKDNDHSGRTSIPEKHEQPSSPIRRRALDVHQLMSPVDQQTVKRDDRHSSQAQDVSAVAAPSGMRSSPIMAHPRPIRFNHVTIINGPGSRPEAEQVPTHRTEFSQDFSFQPKREASSPVRPTESLPQRTALPEAVELATRQTVVFGSQESSALAVSGNHEATVAAATTNNDHVTVARPVEEVPQPAPKRDTHGEVVNGHVEAAKYDLPPHQQTESSQPPAAAMHGTEKHDIDAADSFSAQPEKSSQSKHDMNGNASEESDADTQHDVTVHPPKAASPRPTSIPKTTKKRYAWSHLTPYIDGEYVTHSIYPVAVEASAPASNADAAEAGGDAENADDAAYQADPNADYKQVDVDADEDGNADADADGEGDDVDRDAEHDEDLAPDSQGQPLSQGSAYNSAAPTPALTPRQGSPVLPAAITGTSTPAPLMPKQRFRKQYKFKKIRDPTEFAAYLKDTKELSDEELWYLLEKANECLVAYQEEYKKCTRIVDDQENAQRRAAQDTAFEKKTADLNAFAKVDSYIEKDFEVQGSRATIKEKDAGILDQRWQDRIMANAYGFEYDPHPNKIGNQDPGAQREGGGEGGRQLRSQPQASAKAAEGDGVIVSGKRARNPPKLFDGVLQDDHRAATPGSNKPGPRRRGRAAAADKAASQEQEPDEPEPQATSPARPGPKKRGPRGRRSAVVVSEPGTPVPEEDAVAPPPEPEQAQPLKRKRGRQPKSAAVVIEEPEPEEPEKPAPKRGRAAKRQSNGHVTSTAETTDESRPTSSSSNATISDDGSTYGLRQNKRHRNWKEETVADEEEPEPEPQPKKSRIIRINRKQSAPELAPRKTASEKILTELHDFSTSSTAPDSPRLTVSFKLIGKDHWTLKPAPSPRQTSTDVSEYNLATPRPAPVSAPASAKSSAPPSQAGEEKDYSTMTKSEKMSASMKKRWLNGSMQGAVNKRKATLAAKKQAAALAEAQAAQAAQQKAMSFQQIGPFPMGPSK
ncbi:hypothetical protein CGRA01v4_02122 [Colletotrichum graminicola]|uniref:Uncharacterized protein n=1 Tax=Colletotrichum graminicola (strain M1.001 / M2 / FGSC 10212) TaxID=645133 RepID=E3QRW0_COLGM|nr:uncharacterized protein GLRG_08527 [Colletotrichum graminicola M1.001]EFQ33598.1 hypothetical protein GLRG_08527 [Colletotrichum graminicola M1.001]WDK10843.1 hypothetical protein CGRA01v4_02122 [Colletotrichum graminicola]